MGLRDPSDADDWRQALELAAFACDRELGVDGPVELRCEARFSGGWQFGAWSPSESAFTACLQREVQNGPQPDQRRLQVSIHVLSAG